MNKRLLFFLAFTLLSMSLPAQGKRENVLFIIDSIPLLYDPEDWNQLLRDDIADITIIQNKDSLKLLGWEKLDGVTYIFTKAYRSRPDSVKKIPSLRQMETKINGWHFNKELYSGKYIDFYNNGKIQAEGNLVNGIIDGEVVTYFKNGFKKSVTRFKNGVAHGSSEHYYINGRLIEKIESINGKIQPVGESYFITGEVERERKPKNATPYDTIVTYYSTGKIKNIRLFRNRIWIADKITDDINYYTTNFYQSLRAKDIKAANKYFYKVWLLDSTSTDTHFMAGSLMLLESRFDEAIIEFDKALAMEPLMRETITHSAIARIKKYKFLGIRPQLKNYTEAPLTVEDLVRLPVADQEKVCADVRMAVALDYTESYIYKFISIGIINFCINPRTPTSNACRWKIVAATPLYCRICTV